MKTISWHEFRQKAARQPQRIVLAEGEDARVLEAAHRLHSEKIAIPIIVGSRLKIETLWRQRFQSAPTIQMIDPSAVSATDKQRWADLWRSLPRNKKATPEEALAKIQDPLVFGCLYLKAGEADGFVGGAVHTTADTLRAAFSIIGLAPRTSCLFGFFLLENKANDGLVLLADCAVIPEPSAKQLAHIAVGAAAAYEFFCARTPKIAFLSFSTAGSAAHPLVDKTREALRVARTLAPGLEMEGEWQADAALDSFTARVKGVGDSPLAGQINVLIAPDLQCGNIAYKLVQRLGQARSVGPILWGMAQPANDLSRGCTAEDIVDVAALTAIQAQAPRQATAVSHKENPS